MSEQDAVKKPELVGDAKGEVKQYLPPDPKRDPKTGHFGKGNRANPKGRTKGAVSLTTLLRELLRSRVNPNDKSKNALTRADAFVAATLANAENGNPTCINQIWERMDGKVPDRLEAKVGSNWETIYEEADGSAESEEDWGEEALSDE